MVGSTGFQLADREEGEDWLPKGVRWEPCLDTIGHWANLIGVLPDSEKGEISES